MIEVYNVLYFKRNNYRFSSELSICAFFKSHDEMGLINLTIHACPIFQLCMYTVSKINVYNKSFPFISCILNSVMYFSLEELILLYS